METKVVKMEHIKPGLLCLDNGRLCVLVKIEDTPERLPNTLLDQAGMFKPLGYFVDLVDPGLEFVPVSSSTKEVQQFLESRLLAHWAFRYGWKVRVFSRNLEVVEWINLDTVEEVGR